MAGEVIFIDLSDDVLDELEDAVHRALERCGNQAEGYAQDLAPHATTNLQQSISHKVVESEKTAYIGTNVEYAPYVEFGTGEYATTGGGRPGWWVYVPGSSSRSSKSGKIYTKEQALRIMFYLRSKGINAQITHGQPPQPFLKPAVADHVQIYKNIIKDELKSG